MERGRRIALNSAINITRRPVAVVIGILLTPFILHQIGKEAYGIWALTGSLLSYAALLKLGLNAAVDLHVPRLTHARDAAGVNRVVSTVFAFYLLSALAISLLAALLVWKFPAWFGVGPQLRETSRWVVAWVGLGVVVALPLSVFHGVLAGVQRFDLIAGPNVTFQLVRAVLIVLLFNMGFGLIALTVITVLAELATSGVILAVAFRECRGLSVRPRHVDWPTLPGLMSYSASNLMYTSGQLIMLQSGKALTGLLFDPTAVTEFTIPFMALTMVSQVVMQGVVVLKPAVSLMHSLEETASIRRAYLLVTKYGFMIGIPACAVFLLNGGALLQAWVGPELGAGSVARGTLLLAILCVPQMLRQARLGGFMVLSGLGRHRLFGATVLLQGLASIVLAWALAGPGNLGLVGIALGYAIPEALASGLVVPLHCGRTLGVGLWQEARVALLPAALGSLPFVLYCLAVRLWLPVLDRLEFVLVFGLSVVPMAVGAWFLGLDSAERARFRSYLPARIRRGQAGP